MQSAFRHLEQSFAAGDHSIARVHWDTRSQAAAPSSEGLRSHKVGFFLRLPLPEAVSSLHATVPKVISASVHTLLQR